MGQEILQGSTALLPYKQGTRTGCDYCPYHAVCGFDRKTSGYAYRKLRAIKPEEIWKEILPKEEEEEESEEMVGSDENIEDEITVKSLSKQKKDAENREVQDGSKVD